jgi:hypothetical protein
MPVHTSRTPPPPLTHHSPAEVVVDQDPVLKGDDLPGALGAQNNLSEAMREWVRCE